MTPLLVADLCKPSKDVETGLQETVHRQALSIKRTSRGSLSILSQKSITRDFRVKCNLFVRDLASFLSLPPSQWLFSTRFHKQIFVPAQAYGCDSLMNL